MPRKIEEDPPFIMKLSGPKEPMFRLVGLLLELHADVDVKSTKTTARIVATVPQKNAAAAMRLAGLP